MGFDAAVNSAVGRRLRCRREELALTRKKLAECAEISVQFLADIETGRKGMTVQTLRIIKNYGMKASAVINPNTPVESLYDCVEDADMLLLMSVHPGWGGQRFLPETLQKIEKLRAFCIKSGKPDMDIEVDGGITEENVDAVIEAGANVIVAGSTVFRSQDMKWTISRLHGSAK